MHVLRVIFVAVGTLAACLCAHESGHVIAAYLSGGAIQNVALVSLEPHVSIIGAATQGQEIFRSVGGSVSSLALCFLFLLIAPSRGDLWQLARCSAIAFGSVELLGWSLSSLTRVHSLSPDDAERFVNASGASPYSIVGVCLFIAFAGSAILLWRRRSA